MIKQVLTIIAFCILISSIKTRTAETTFLIDDFAIGNNILFDQTEGGFGIVCSIIDYTTIDYRCDFGQTLCLSQTSNAAGGNRYINYLAEISAFTPQYETDQFAVQEEVEITVANNVWEATSNLTNSGNYDWSNDFSYILALNFFSACDESVKKVVDLLTGGGSSIAFSLDSELPANLSPLEIILEVIDEFGRKFKVGVDSFMFDSSIGQYVVDLDSSVCDFTRVVILTIQMSTKGNSNFSVTPTKSISLNFKVSNVRVISEIVGETTVIYGPQSTLSSQFQSSSSSSSSGSSRSSDNSSNNSSSCASLVNPSLVSLFLILLIAFYF